MATILVAGGDAAFNSALSAVLTAEGHDVVVAADGAEACERATDAAPDLVFLDASLPVFDGLETCARLRSDPEVSPSLPIVLVTPTAINNRKLDAAGVTTCLFKHQGVTEVRDLLAKYLPSITGP